MKKMIIVLAMAVGLVGLFPAVAEASGASLNPICDDGGLDEAQKEAAGCNADGNYLVDTQIPGVVTAILWLSGMLAVAMIIYAGVKMIMAQGDSSKIELGKKTLQYAVVGLIIVLLASVVVNFVAGAFSGGDGEEGASIKTSKEVQIG